MQAEIIAIGSELTNGAKLDTNSQWLSQELALAGVSVSRHTAIADDTAALVDEFRAAAARAQVVIITGGLGPTLDDLTRQCLAEAFHQQLVEDPEALRHLEELFLIRGRTMPERNRIQAMRPEQAALIPNPRGTAPGILLTATQARSKHNCLLAALPGVPREMMPMFLESVVPKLPGTSRVIRQVVLRTFGLGESDVEKKLGDLTARGRNPEVGITASDAVISLTITAISATEADCRHLIENDRSAIRQALGNLVYGEGNCELHETLSKLLSGAGQSVSVVEGTSTGGMIHHWLTTQFAIEAAHVSHHDESSEACREGIPHWLRDGIVAPHLLETAVDEPTGPDMSPPHQQREAQQLLKVAEQQRSNSGADFGIATSNMRDTVTASGIRKRLGSIAIAGPDFRRVEDVSFSGNLAIFQARAARTAVNFLRLHLLEQMDQR